MLLFGESDLREGRGPRMDLHTASIYLDGHIGQKNINKHHVIVSRVYRYNMPIFDLTWILPCPPATCQQILREGSRQQGIEFARGGAEDGTNVRDVVIIRQFPLLLVLSNRGQPHRMASDGKMMFNKQILGYPIFRHALVMAVEDPFHNFQGSQQLWRSD